MILEKRSHRIMATAISLTVLVLITIIAKNIVGINAITVALLYLLAVLVTSAITDLACGFVIAVVSGLLVNYYFLPPFGTLYIEAPDDWVSFFSYTITAVVVSHFSATVRRRAFEADRLHSQLSGLCRFTDAIMAIPEKSMTLELLTGELNRAYGLSYCAIYLFDGNGTSSPVFSGTRPSRMSQKGEVQPNLPNKLLDVVAEEGPDVQCLTLKDQGKTVGALVISQVSLSQEVAEELAGIVSLVVRQKS